MERMKGRSATLLQEGIAAANAGERGKARRAFRAALFFDPENVAALLWLAWLNSDPRASLAYVARALSIAPHDPRTRAALHWARQRAARPVPQTSSPAAPAKSPSRSWQVALALIPLILIIGIAVLWTLRQDVPVLAAYVRPSPTLTATASPPPLPTSTPVHTLSPTRTPIPTATASPTPTDIPPPSTTPTPTVTPRPAPPTAPLTILPATLSPSSVADDVRWIDVDLTNQRLTAYEGQTTVRTTLVSTGLPRTPTPVGLFRIWIKLRYDDMSGPGYYLPNVPYTMYFYRGYGLHGTYWHSNFGHPMSHGCVNLPTSEAEWLFSWAEVGTLVNIHY